MKAANGYIYFIRLPMSGQSEKVCLLIDDDPDDQEIFELALAKVDPPVKCRTASSCHEGLELLSPQNNFIPHCIFLDLNMPRVNGKQCLAMIRKLEHLRDVPVIMYSTSLIESDIHELKQLGAMAFVTKPNNIATLATLLRDFFTNDRLSPVSR